jgi:hypothetical protein
MFGLLGRTSWPKLRFIEMSILAPRKGNLPSFDISMASPASTSWTTPHDLFSRLEGVHIVFLGFQDVRGMDRLSELFRDVRGFEISVRQWPKSS